MGKSKTQGKRDKRVREAALLRLHKYAAVGAVKKAKKLLRSDKAPAIDGGLADGRTALHMACRHGHMEMAEALLRHGADVVAVDWENSTPAHLAARHGHLEVLAALLQAQPSLDVDTRDAAGQTIRELADAAMAAQDAAEMKVGSRGEGDASAFEDTSASWEERLREELDGYDDDEDAWQRYGSDAWEHGAGGAQESEDVYAQRIWEAMRRKQQAAAGLGPATAEEWARADSAAARRTAAAAAAAAESARILDRERARDAEWRAAVAQGDVVARRATYEARWQLLVSQPASSTIAPSSIPWLPSGPEEARGMVLCGTRGPEEARRRVRMELMRWHPDKFAARFGTRLGGEAAPVLERVKAVAQLLTSFIAPT